MEDLTPLIQEVKSRQSAEAFYKIVQLCEARVFTMCYRIIGNREEAEEAAQDVFMNCYKNIHSLDDDHKFIQWLLRIAYHRSIDYVRKRKMKYEGLDSEKIQHHSEVNMPHHVSEKGNLDAYLKPYDEEEKAIITLYYQEGYSTKEISNILALTVSNVKIKLHRARSKIRDFIENKNSSIPS